MQRLKKGQKTVKLQKIVILLQIYLLQVLPIDFFLTILSVE